MIGWVKGLKDSAHLAGTYGHGSVYHGKFAVVRVPANILHVSLYLSLSLARALSLSLACPLSLSLSLTHTHTHTQTHTHTHTHTHIHTQPAPPLPLYPLLTFTYIVMFLRVGDTTRRILGLASWHFCFLLLWSFVCTVCVVLCVKERKRVYFLTFLLSFCCLYKLVCARNNYTRFSYTLSPSPLSAPHPPPLSPPTHTNTVLNIYLDRKKDLVLARSGDAASQVSLLLYSGSPLLLVYEALSY
jgi:hypothetical protein